MIPEIRGSHGNPRPPKRVGWAVRNAARIVPRANCLTQAMAAQFLLARAGHRSDMRIGVARDAAGKLVAHAWVVCGNAVIVGGSAPELRRYSVMTPLDVAP